MREIRSYTWSAVTAIALLCAASTANAQELHGINIAKGCISPMCVGELSDCEIQIGYNDGLGDTIRIIAAWDVVDVTGDAVRVPDSGNLPIVEVGGNTTCTVGGSLPCLIGPADSTLSGLPGTDADGFVRFKQDTYVIQADDPDVLRDQATVEWEDLCDDPETSGCATDITNPAPAPASTLITRCDDQNDCTTDTCEAGECTFSPECTEDAECDDGNACIADSCSAEGCCEYAPVDCDDGNTCTEDSCDQATGCVNTPISCDDMNACTEDSCDPATGCVNTPISCDDGNDCTTDSCDPATGCVHVPDCSTDADCDDTNACTTDSCSAEGCCEYAPVDCNDGNDCTTDSCDPATGCVHVPDCATDADCDDMDACTVEICTPDSCCEYTPVICDDGDECTEDTCDSETGCVYTPIDPPPPGCGEFAGCTPGFWKQRQHFQYWINYSQDDLFETVFGVDAIVLDGKTLLEAAWTGGGHEAALGRHAVAALLNAASGEVDYAYSEAEVIALVQQAYATGDFNGAKNMLAEENERGCTVDKSHDADTKDPLRGSSRPFKGR